MDIKSQRSIYQTNAELDTESLCNTPNANK